MQPQTRAQAIPFPSLNTASRNERARQSRATARCSNSTEAPETNMSENIVAKKCSSAGKGFSPPLKYPSLFRPGGIYCRQAGVRRGAAHSTSDSAVCGVRKEQTRPEPQWLLCHRAGDGHMNQAPEPRKTQRVKKTTPSKQLQIRFDSTTLHVNQAHGNSKGRDDFHS